FDAGNANDLTPKANNGTLSGGAAVVNPADRLFLSGTRISNFTFPAATNATTSMISWVQTATAGTTVKIETSLDNGATFQTAVNASDPNGEASIQKFDVRLSIDGGANFNLTVAPNVAGTARKFTWTVPVGFNTTQARIRVIVTDTQGATSQDDSNANFTIAETGVV